MPAEEEEPDLVGPTVLPELGNIDAVDCMGGAGSVSSEEGVLADYFAERKRDKKKKRQKKEEKKREEKRVGLAGDGVSGGQRKKEEKEGKKGNERIGKGEQIDIAVPMEQPVGGFVEERAALVDGEEIDLVDHAGLSVRGVGTAALVERKIDLDGSGRRRRKSSIPKRLAQPVVSSADPSGEGDAALASLMEGLSHEVSRKKKKREENPSVLATDHVAEEVPPSKVVEADLVGSSVREEIHLADSMEATARVAREDVFEKRKKRKGEEKRKARGEGDEWEQIVPDDSMDLLVRGLVGDVLGQRNRRKKKHERREEKEREEKERVAFADSAELFARGTGEEIRVADFAEGAARVVEENVFEKKKKKQKKKEVKKKTREEERQVNPAEG